jgi:hypothetical protein
VLGEFKAGRSPILIATDVASRGLGMSSSSFLCMIGILEHHAIYGASGPFFWHDAPFLRRSRVRSGAAAGDMTCAHASGGLESHHAQKLPLTSVPGPTCFDVSRPSRTVRSWFGMVMDSAADTRTENPPIKTVLCFLPV